MKPLFLELFAGSCTMSKAARDHGFEVISSDLEPFPGVDLVCDVLNFDCAAIEKPVSVLWASPPCTSFSVASIGHHWTGGHRAYIPKTEGAKKGMAILEKTLEIIEELKPDIFFIENPRGLMRKMPALQHLKRHTVTYCQYGDRRMKPTDIWTNSETWEPRPMCKNGDSCHEAAPRGSRTGTQGLKNNFERSKIPVELCLEIVTTAKKELECKK